MEAAMLWQSVLHTLPLAALRVLAWLLIGFAIALAGGLAGVIAALAAERWASRASARGHLASAKPRGAPA